MRNWTNWNIAYRYPDIVEREPEPAADELNLALTLIAHLAVLLRSLGPPPDRNEITDGA